MRVVQLGPYPPPHGGVQTNLVAIREYLRGAGARCDVVNLTRFRRQDGDGVHYPVSAAQVVKLLLRLRPAVFHLHIGGNVTLRLLLLGLLASLVSCGRTVLTFHSGGYPSSLEGRTASPWTLRGFVFRRFAAIIAVNPEMVAMFARFGVPRERIHLIPPYVVPARPPEVSLPTGIERFFARHDPALVSMGWLEPEYDFPLQIRALAELRRRYPRAGLIILGEGRLEQELRSQADAAGCADAVLLAGDVPHATALAVLARASVYLRTTWYDGDAISVREALGFGTPVIASDNGMRPSGVRLIPPRDLPALREAIEQSIATPCERKPASASGEENIRAVWELYRTIGG